jgi:hypothetical protein
MRGMDGVGVVYIEVGGSFVSRDEVRIESNGSSSMILFHFPQPSVVSSHSHRAANTSNNPRVMLCF